MIIYSGTPPPTDNDRGYDHNVMQAFPQEKNSHYTTGIKFEFVNSVDLLGVPLYAELKVNHIHRNVQKFIVR